MEQTIACRAFNRKVEEVERERGAIAVTYYSDLLLLLGELEAVEVGRHPKRPPRELRALCRNILAIDPGEEIASKLLAALDELPNSISSDGLVSFLTEKARAMLRSR